MRSDERGSPIRSDSHAESHRNDRGFLRRGEDLSPAPTWPPASASGVDSNFVAAFFASSRLNVFDSWRDLPRLATTVCLPGSAGGTCLPRFWHSSLSFSFVAIRP